MSNFSRQKIAENRWKDIARVLFYVEGSFNDARAYEQLKAKLDVVDQQFGIPNNRVFYLAVPPTAVDASVSHLKQAGMVSPVNHDTFTRVIVEKPIGRDLASAKRGQQCRGQSLR